MDARVCHVLLPVGQKMVLRRQTLKAPSLDCIVLRILDPGFHLALVSRHRWLGRQNHGAVMASKLLQLGVNLRIVPIGLDHARLEVVDDNGGWNPAQIPKGIFQTSDEALSSLAPHRLAVTLARMAQYPAK